MDEEGIDYDVCPGVSSFCGAAAALKAEYTLPDVSQSVIITRMAGRTPVPEKESIASFAEHGANVIIVDMDETLLERTKKEVEALGVNVASYVCDVSDEESVNKIMAAIKKFLRPITLLNQSTIGIAIPLAIR